MGETVDKLLAKVKTKTFVYILLCLLGTVCMGWASYVLQAHTSKVQSQCDRIEKLEQIHEEQNGTVSDVSKDVKALLDTMGDLRTEQRKHSDKLDDFHAEQRSQRTDIDWIKETLKHR